MKTLHDLVEGDLVIYTPPYSSRSRVRTVRRTTCTRLILGDTSAYRKDDGHQVGFSDAIWRGGHIRIPYEGEVEAIRAIEKEKSDRENAQELLKTASHAQVLVVIDLLLNRATGAKETR